MNDGADSPASAEGVLALLKQGKSVHIIPSLLDTRLFRQSLGDVAGIPVLSVSKGELSPDSGGGETRRRFRPVGGVVGRSVAGDGRNRARGEIDLAGPRAIPSEAPGSQRQAVYPL